MLQSRLQAQVQLLAPSPLISQLPAVAPKMPSASNLSEICIPMGDEPAYAPRKLRVATIGAGYSGLTMAHKIQHQHPELQEFIEHTIFEANSGIGGTWKVNTYPGVQCDVPSHIYVSSVPPAVSYTSLLIFYKAFPFDPNPNWKKFYSDGDEILEYMERICDKWDLRRDVQFNTRVVAADWQDGEGKWKITVEKDGQKREEFFDVVLSAIGFLKSVHYAVYMLQANTF
jgi:cation diffusion facilitator CzcD-associated flavoprotein CzcO